MEQRLLTAAQLADYGRELKSLCGPAGGEDGYGGVANESGEIVAVNYTTKSNTLGK